MRRNLWVIVVSTVLLVIIFGGALVGLYTDWLWFSDIGYLAVFSTILFSKIGLAIAFGLLFFIIVYANLRIAKWLAPTPTRRYEAMEDDLRERLGALARHGLGVLLFLGTLVVAIFVALQAGTEWNAWLLFRNGVGFGANDPMYGLDIGFYVFKLPFLNFLYGWLFFTLAVAAIASAALHYAYQGLDYFGNVPRFSPGVKAHLAVLLAAMFFLKAAGYKLMMYRLVQAPGELFVGAGYTDVAARLPALWILFAAAIAGGVLVLLNIYRRGIWLAAGAFVGLLVVSILVGAVYPAIIEAVIVKPNELEKQRPYITRAITYTRQAFKLDTIAARKFDYQPTLTPEQISANLAAVQNLRLWDYPPLQRTYQQQQELQPYYNFVDVDIDRYTINGEYRQVMLSARELSGPPQSAQTWLNQYLRYTHGYAYAMSPVNAVTAEGLPEYFVKDMPPKILGGPPLTTPQVYFGQLTQHHVLVNTARKEFDYPGLSGDVDTTYSAKSGPTIGNFMRRLLFALRFSDVNIILSSDLRPGSRILFRRDIRDRAQTLFPFLDLDRDPYLVSVGGRMYWFHDAYTTTSQYPYAEASSVGGANYMRNSVKLVTDAYTGKVQAWISDPDDPIVRTYSRIFPGIFRPMSQMTPDFRAHVRYPEDYFTYQAHTFAKYHVTDPDTFYSGTDLWRLPQSVTPESEGGILEPYYVITRLPNSQSEEFILIVPMIRSGKENMVAWMAAKCDPADYGKLITYEFPRGSLVFGPTQVMSRANQDTEISEALTLWGQQKSTVVRGKLLAIPIENSILYVEPLYLESTETKIPEFKQVIVALGDRVVMRETLDQALAAVVGVDSLPEVARITQPSLGAARPSPERPSPRVRTTAPAAPSADVRSLVARAQTHYSRAQEAQRKGDWAGYGREIANLKKTLDELQKRSR